MKYRHVKELKTKNRETGELHTYYLCTRCISSIADFVRILRRRRYDSRCDRCAWSQGQADQDATIGRPPRPLS
jgi:hypothetical protein